MNEQAKVGLVVLIAGAILLAGIFYMTNLGLGSKYAAYKAHFKFAGGLEPGAPVRFAGLKVGRVKSVRVSPQDPGRIEIELQVNQDTPVRSDSSASLSQLGLLGENYVEIQPGTSSGTRLASGSTIPSVETADLAALMRRMNALAEQAQPLIADLHKSLNQISVQADAVLGNLREVTGQTNRAHLAGIIRQTDEMLAKNSPKIETIATNLQNASGKLDPLMADLRTTSAKLDKLIAELNSTVTENRPDLKAAIAELSKTLVVAREMVGQLNTTLTSNSENLDATMENMRSTSQNLRELSDTLKQRPYSLVRIRPKPDRQVPGAGKSAAGQNRSTGSKP